MSLGVDESMWAATMGDPIGIGPPHPEEGKAGTSSQSQRGKGIPNHTQIASSLGIIKRPVKDLQLHLQLEGKEGGLARVPLQMGGGRAAAPRRDATVEIPTTRASGVRTGSSAVGTTGFDVPTQSSGVGSPPTRAKGTSVWAAF
ncbi:hypothetical protein Acr_11g0015040 [Actinidia rufa]|uniref:Uncharacterized protein n=1 Tax=Actinidia rufa TaxID=165716 RepID=A0A7J0FEU8_9ERIC|nr:hypothetical protein Acr_11g0015040 [Actinidia rufa]